MIRVKLIQIGADVLERFPQLTDATVRFRLARDIMEGARAHLIKKASEQLHSTRADYINGVQPIERDGKGVVLALVGVLPNMVENGWDGGFLHDTLLGDDATGWKLSADGFRYRAIPFRHKTPTAGPQGGQPMGSQFNPSRPGSLAAAHTTGLEGYGLALGKSIHKQAKKLITKAEAGAGQSGPTRLAAGLAPKLRPHHTTDIFAGMIVNKQPVQKGHGVGFQRSYTTFRMISEARPDAWFHPGIAARDFLEDAENWIEKHGAAAVQAFANEVLK